MDKDAEAAAELKMRRPGVVFFCGPMAHRADHPIDIPVDALLETLDDFLAERSIGWGYGALASGADIIIAETLIKAGVNLNIYLPVPPDAFLKSSVEIGGPGWTERFNACMSAASSIEWNHRAASPCNATYRLGAEIAMGKAIRHAAQLGTEAVGFFAAPFSGDPARSMSLANFERWKARGLPHVVARANWPARKSSANTTDAQSDLVLFALVLQDGGDERPARSLAAGADFSLRHAAGAINLLLFHTLEDALAAAAMLSKSASGASWRCWLDAGVFSAAMLAGGAEQASAQLAAAVRPPVTEPGKVFASDAFASAAELHPAITATFEPVGLAPKREKTDPCPLYRIQF
jgi:hypothetical protein